MREAIETLAESLFEVSDDSNPPTNGLVVRLQDSYRYFLSLCDGGYTPDRFFHFFGQKGPQEHNLDWWNRFELWKKHYALDETAFVFAEDILGTQFCFDIRGNRRVVKMLIPTTGSLTLCANSFDEFVQFEVLPESNTRQVRQLAEKFWKTQLEQWRPFSHLACKIPPALGGSDSDLANLRLTKASTNLRILGQINEQVKRLPVGTRISDVKIDFETEEVVLVPENPC